MVNGLKKKSEKKKKIKIKKKNQNFPPSPKRRHFQFGWTGTPSIANGLAMQRLPLPSLLVVNTSSLHHYIPEQEPHELTQVSNREQYALVFFAVKKEVIALISVFS